MKCNDCPYALCNSQICQIKCDYKQEKSKKVKVPTRIKQVSEKRKLEDIEYKRLRLEFLSKPENKICPIMKTETTDVHHQKGRIGKLYLDTTFWLALSREGHRMVEENPEWAKEQGYSLNRI
jgi:hypothetical protein